MICIIWNFAYSKQILDSHQTQQDTTPGGDLECVEANKATGRVGGPAACEVKPHSKPWMVKTYGCGGALLSKRVVLTAAHCICKIVSASPEEYQPAGQCTSWQGKGVTVGENDTMEEFEIEDQWIEIENAVAHKDWTGRLEDGFDVALLFLEEDAILSKVVQVAALPQYDENCPLGNVLTLSGWGVDAFSESHHVLWAVKQEWLNITECPFYQFVPQDGPILCVGDKNDPRNSGYWGDSGGPLTYTDKLGKTTVFGIASALAGGGPDVGPPLGFSRVSYPQILDWIKNTMEKYYNNQQLE